MTNGDCGLTQTEYRPGSSGERRESEVIQAAINPKRREVDKGAQGNDDALFINSGPGVTFKSGM